jgi:UDP-N-acetylmuramyl tripeptide synthase
LLPLPFILLVARAAGWTSRVLRRGRGTSLPGVVALRLFGGVLARLVADLPDGVVVVTGTNGKTSTAGLVRAALEAAGTRVAANTSGSNLEQGIVTALIQDRGVWGRPRSSTAVLEVDEAALGRLATALSPRLVVVLNLFRDQLDRHAELDRVAATVGDALSRVSCPVLLNADDARVAALATYARGPVAYFGFDRPIEGQEPAQAAGDVSPCPSCGGRLAYAWVAYAQLGAYECPACGLRRPRPTVALTAALPRPDGGWRVHLRAGGEDLGAVTALRGAYGVANLVAAVAAARELGVAPAAALDAAAACEPVAGRGARTRVGAGEVIVLLGKNPTGVAQILDAYVCREPAAPLLLVLNDAAADGRDVSWIWDAPLEGLCGRARPVLVAGSRSESMLVRLEYAEVPARGFDTVAAALDELVAQVVGGGRAFVVTTYSAVQPVTDGLARRADALVGTRAVA